MSEHTKLRIGIGKLDFGLSHSHGPTPWYVTIYNRALTEDRAQGWFETHAEALAYANKMLPEWKRWYRR